MKFFQPTNLLACRISHLQYVYRQNGFDYLVKRFKTDMYFFFRFVVRLVLGILLCSMITPQFSVRQDERFVYIDIRAPNIKASEVEFYAHDDLFIFSLHPYYLRLRFPGNLKDDPEEQTAAEDDVKDEDMIRMLVMI